MTLSTEQLRRRFLECMVCLENFDEEEHTPHVLPCFHVCCYSCLQNILQDGHVICPTCKTSHVVKQNDVRTFCKDNTRRDMLDFLSQISRPVPTRCTNCEENDAETRCDSCQDSLCSECTRAHRRTKLTASHVLTGIAQQPTESINTITDSNHCQKPGHADKLLDKFCTTEGCRHLVCEFCCKDSHLHHCIKPVRDVYTEHKTELHELVDNLQIKRDALEALKVAVENDLTTLLENQTSVRQQIEQTFESCMTVLIRRRDELVNKLNVICKMKVKSLETCLDELNFRNTEMLNVLSLTTQTLEADEISLLQIDTALKLKIDGVLKRVDLYEKSTNVNLNARLPDLLKRFENFTMRLGDVSDNDVSVKRTKVDMTDAIVGVSTTVLECYLYDEAGNLIKAADIDIVAEIISDSFETNICKAQYVETNNSYCIKMTPTKPGKHKVSLIILGETLKKDLSFDVKASLDNSGVQTSKGQSPLLRSSSNDRPQLRNLKSHSTEMSSETGHGSKRLNELQNVVSVSETFSSLDALQFYCSPAVSSVIQKRFETWNLIGEWGNSPNRPRDLVMYSRTDDEARLCLDVLKETVLEKVISVRPESMVVLESDKWQGIVGALGKKYTSPIDKVEISVDHANNKILCYSLSTTALKDAGDAIFIFLRDNDIKVLKLKYTEEIIALFRKAGQQKVKTIQNSLSQFCVGIKDYKDVIEVRGIGIGLGKAVLELDALVKEILEDADEDRFSSDDEAAGDKTDDSISRFGGQKLEINEILMNVSDCKFHGMYFIGDDRMIFVSEGDLTTFRVDALVNAADKRLKHDGGLAKAIVLKGGYSIQAECSEYVFNHGEVKEGNVFCSQSGKMECHTIIHAVGPVWRGGKEGESKKLQDTVRSILTEASRRKLGSVVIPALCTGKNRFPPQESASCVVNAVKDFFHRNPRTILREVYLCGDGACAPYMTEACENVFGVKEAVRVTQPSKDAGRKEADIRGRVQATLLG